MLVDWVVGYRIRLSGFSNNWKIWSLVSLKIHGFPNTGTYGPSSTSVDQTRGFQKAVMISSEFIAGCTHTVLCDTCLPARFSSDL